MEAQGHVSRQASNRWADPQREPIRPRVCSTLAAAEHVFPLVLEVKISERAPLQRSPLLTGEEGGALSARSLHQLQALREEERQLISSAIM